MRLPWVIKGLEFTSIANVKEMGELEEFVQILKLLEKRRDVKSVEVIVGQLPEGVKGKKFSKLKDGRTKRRYAVGRIVMMDGGENCLIEAEREDRALSILLLKSNILINWKMVCSMLLLGLVNESGKWSNSAIEKIENMEIVVLRNKHIKKSIYEKEIQIYEKLIKM